MRPLVLCLLLVFASSLLLAQGVGDKILGRWVNDDRSAQFDVYKTGDTYSASIIWLAQPNDKHGNPKTDKNNPDEKLRQRPVMGMVIFSGLKFGNGKWGGTEVYSPEKGMKAKLNIEMAGDNHLVVIASKGIFTNTKNWTRL